MRGRILPAARRRRSVAEPGVVGCRGLSMSKVLRWAHCASAGQLVIGHCIFAACAGSWHMRCISGAVLLSL